MAVVGNEKSPLFPPRSHDNGENATVQNGTVHPHSKTNSPETSKQVGPIMPPKQQTVLAQNRPIMPPNCKAKAVSIIGRALNGPLIPPKSPRKTPVSLSPPESPHTSPILRRPRAAPLLSLIVDTEDDDDSPLSKNEPVLSPSFAQKTESAKKEPLLPPKAQKTEPLPPSVNPTSPKAVGTKNGPIFPPKTIETKSGPIFPPKSPPNFEPKLSKNPSQKSVTFKTPQHLKSPNRQRTIPKELEVNEQDLSDSQLDDEPTTPVKRLGSNSSYGPLLPPISGTRVKPKSETVNITQNGREMESLESENYAIFTPKKTTVAETGKAKSPKVPIPNGTRGSMRLLHIEPTMSGRTSSEGSNDSTSLEDSGEDQRPFPCSMSPSTLQSMELLFSFSDEDILDKLADSWPVKCTYIVKEMIETERVYVQSLADIIKGYLTPLYSYVLENGESPNFISSVFGNIVKIHQIHTSLLHSMQNTCTRPEDFARVFLDCDFLSQYTVYCTSYSKGNKKLETTLSLESDLKHFIVDCQKNLSHTLPLTSYLIKPVQRILKYPLLLEDLKKKFDWTEHPGRLKLKQALEKMSSVATEINTAFNDQNKAHGRSSPKVIAQRRLHQIKDLQKSRSVDNRQSTHPHHSLIQTNSLPHAYSGVSLFPVPSRICSLNRFSHLEEKSSATVRPTSIYASLESKDSGASKPRVSDLKGFYEKLTEHSEKEMRRGSILTRSKSANSMDSGSFVQVQNPPVSRATSFGSVFKLGSKKKKTDSKPKTESKSLLKRFGKGKKPSK